MIFEESLIEQHLNFITLIFLRIILKSPLKNTKIHPPKKYKNPPKIYKNQKFCIVWGDFEFFRGIFAF